MFLCKLLLQIIIVCASFACCWDVHREVLLFILAIHRSERVFLAQLCITCNCSLCILGTLKFLMVPSWANILGQQRLRGGSLIPKPFLGIRREGGRWEEWVRSRTFGEHAIIMHFPGDETIAHHTSYQCICKVGRVIWV